MQKRQFCDKILSNNFIELEEKKAQAWAYS